MVGLLLGEELGLTDGKNEGETLGITDGLPQRKGKDCWNFVYIQKIILNDDPISLFSQLHGKETRIF